MSDDLALYSELLIYLSGSFVYDRERVTPMRPRTIGFRFSYDY